MATTHKSDTTHSTSHQKSRGTAQETAGTLSAAERTHLSGSTYAFPEKRKEPLNDASHVRNAIARFAQVKDVTDEEREQAFHHIKTAAKKFGVEMTETNWKDLGKNPQTSKSTRKKAS